MGIWTSTSADWIRTLYGLLGRGLIWTREEGRRLTKLITGASDEFVRVHNRAGDLMEEADPQTTTEMLPDWERVAGLPEFGYAPTAVADRRDTLLGKLASQGGQDLQYFEDVAVAYGATGATTEDGPNHLEWTLELEAADFVRACCTSQCTASLGECLTGTGERVAKALTHRKPSHTRLSIDGGCAP